MDWASSQWKEGLSSLALQKVSALETTVEKLQKERQQKQLQLECLELTLSKEKRKNEESKQHSLSLERELQSLSEACKNLEIKEQKLVLDIQNRDSRLKNVENLLAQSKKQNCRLQQLENDIEDLKCLRDNSKLENKKLEEKLKKEQNTVEKQTDAISELEQTIRGLQNKYSSDKTIDLLTDSDKENLASNDSNCELSSVEGLLKKIREQESEIKNLKSQVQASAKLNDSFVSPLNESILTPSKSRNVLAETSRKSYSIWDSFGLTPSKASKQANESSTFDSDEKVRSLNQKIKQLSQELECQRHNSEAAKATLELRLKEKENSLKAEVKQLSQTISDQDKELKDLQTKYHLDVVQANKKLDILNAQLQKSEFSKQQLEKDLKTVEAQVSTCNSLLSQRDDELKDLQKQKNMAETVLKSLQSEKREFERSLSILSSEKKSLVEENSDLKLKLDGSNNLAKEQETLIQSLKKDKGDALKAKFDIEKTAQQLEKSISQISSEIESYKKQLEKLHQDGVASNEKVKKLEEEKSCLSKLLESAKVEKKTAETKMLSELEKLKTEFDCKVQEAEKLKMELDSTKSANDKATQELEKSVSQLNSEIVSYKTQLKKLCKDSEATNGKVTKLEEENSHLSSLLETAKVDKNAAETKMLAELEKLQSEYDRKVQEAAQLNSEIDSYKTQLEKLCQDSEATNGKVKKLEEENSHLSNLLETAKVDKNAAETQMLAELEKLQSEYDRKVQEAAQLISEIDSYKTQLEKLCQDSEAANGKVKKLEEENSHLSNLLETAKVEKNAAEMKMLPELEKLQSEYDCKVQEAAQLNSEIDSYKTQLEKFCQDSEAANGKVKKLEEENSHLTSLLESSKVEKNAVDTKMLAELEKLKSDCDCKVQEAEKLKMELDSAKSANDAKHLDLQQSLSSMESDLQGLKSQVSSLSAEKKLLEESLKQEQSRCEPLSKSLEEEAAKREKLEKDIGELTEKLSLLHSELSLEKEKTETYGRELIKYKDFSENRTTASSTLDSLVLILSKASEDLEGLSCKNQDFGHEINALRDNYFLAEQNTPELVSSLLAQLDCIDGMNKRMVEGYENIKQGLKIELSQLQCLVHNLNNENQRLYIQKEEAHKMYKQLMDDLNHNFKDTKQGLEMQLSQAHAEISALTSKNYSMAKDISKLKNDCESEMQDLQLKALEFQCLVFNLNYENQKLYIQKEEAHKMYKQVMDHMNRGFKVSTDGLHQQLSLVQSKNASLSSKCNSLSAEKSNLEKRFFESQKVIELLKKDLSERAEAQSKAEELQKTIETLQNKIDNFKKDHDREVLDLKEKNQVSLFDVQDRMHAAHLAQVNELTAKLDTLASEKTELETRVKIYEGKTKEDVNTLREITELKYLLSHMDLENQRLFIQKEELTHMFNSVLFSIKQNNENSKRDLEAQLSQARAEISAFSLENESIVRKVLKLENNLKSKVQDLQHKVLELQCLVCTRDHENQRLYTQKEEAHKIHKLVMDHLKHNFKISLDVKDQLCKTQLAQVNELNRKLDILASEKADLEACVKFYEEKIKEDLNASREITELKHLLSSMNLENQRLFIQKEELTHMFDSLLRNIKQKNEVSLHDVKDQLCKTQLAQVNELSRKLDILASEKADLEARVKFYEEKIEEDLNASREITELKHLLSSLNLENQRLFIQKEELTHMFDSLLRNLKQKSEETVANLKNQLCQALVDNENLDLEMKSILAHKIELSKQVLNFEEKSSASINKVNDSLIASVKKEYEETIKNLEEDSVQDSTAMFETTDFESTYWVDSCLKIPLYAVLSVSTELLSKVDNFEENIHKQKEYLKFLLARHLIDLADIEQVYCLIKYMKKSLMKVNKIKPALLPMKKLAIGNFIPDLCSFFDLFSVLNPVASYFGEGINCGLFEKSIIEYSNRNSQIASELNKGLHLLDNEISASISKFESHLTNFMYQDVHCSSSHVPVISSPGHLVYLYKFNKSFLDCYVPLNKPGSAQSFQPLFCIDNVLPDFDASKLPLILNCIYRLSKNSLFAEAKDSAALNNLIFFIMEMLIGYYKGEVFFLKSTTIKHLEKCIGDLSCRSLGNLSENSLSQLSKAIFWVLHDLRNSVLNVGYLSQEKLAEASAKIEKLELQCADQEQDLASLRGSITREKEISVKITKKFGKTALEKNELLRKLLQVSKVCSALDAVCSSGMVSTDLQPEMKLAESLCLCQKCLVENLSDEYEHKKLSPVSLYHAVVQVVESEIKHKDQVKSLNKKLSDRSADIEFLETESIVLEETLQDLEEVKKLTDQELESLKSEFSSLTNECEKARFSLSESSAKQENLLQTIENYKKNLKLCSDENSTLLLEKKKLTDELTAKEAEVSHLVKFVEEKSSECKNLNAKCEEYQQEISRLHDSESAEYERKSLDTSSEVNALREKIESLLESQRLLSENFEKVEKDFMQLNDDHSLLLSAKDKLEEELAAKEAEVSHLEQCIEEKASECKKLNVKCEDYQQEIDGFNSRMSKLSDKVTEGEGKLQDTFSEMDSLKKKIETLQESNRLLNVTLENVEEDLQGLFSEKQKVQDELQSKLIEIVALEEEVQSWKNKVREEKEKFNSLESSMKELTASQISEKTILESKLLELQYLEPEVKSLKEKLNADSVKIVSLENALKEIQVAHANCDSRFSEVKMENKVLENALKGAKDAHANCDSKFSEMEIKNSTLENALKEMKDAHANCDYKISQIERNNASLENSLMEMKDAHANCDYKISELERKSASLESNLKEQKVIVFEKNFCLKQRDFTISQLKEKLSEIEKEKEAVQTQLSEMNLNYTSQLNAKVETINSLKSNINTATNEKLQLEDKVGKLLSEIAYFKALEKSSSKELENENGFLKEKLEKIEKEKSEIEMTLSLFKEKIISYEEELIQLQNQFENSEADYIKRFKKLEDDLKCEKLSNSDFIHLTQDLERKIESLEKEIIRKEKTSSKIIDDLSSENSALQAQLNALDSQRIVSPDSDAENSEAKRNSLKHILACNEILCYALKTLFCNDVRETQKDNLLSKLMSWGETVDNPDYLLSLYSDLKAFFVTQQGEIELGIIGLIKPICDSISVIGQYCAALDASISIPDALVSDLNKTCLDATMMISGQCETDLSSLTEEVKKSFQVLEQCFKVLKQDIFKKEDKIKSLEQLLEKSKISPEEQQKASVNSLESKVSLYRTNLHRLERQHNKLLASFAEMEVKIKQLKQEKQVIEQEKQVLEQEKQVLEQEKQVLEQEKQVLEQEKQVLEQENQALDQKKLKLEQEKQELEAEADEMAEIIKKHQVSDELVEAYSKLSEATMKLKKLAEENKILKTMLEKCKTSLKELQNRAIAANDRKAQGSQGPA